MNYLKGIAVLIVEDAPRVSLDLVAALEVAGAS